MYDHKKIEKKWQKIWEKEKIYKTGGGGKKFYALDMFPYPSGEGLHVGHPRGYIGTDIIARYKIKRGFSVLHPMGWDAFGLPAENYAIKTKTNPKISADRNIKRFKEQLKIIGLGYDWEREINTTDPKYYKWTQWIFLKLFENGLAYESFEPINWCPSCKTGLANEDLEDGLCERCGSVVEKKPIRQWVLKMTAYAEKLLDDLKLLEWPESIIEQQKNWIGRSEGTEMEFKIKNSELKIKVFTTRIDTIFGCTYIVLAPEHEIISNLKYQISNIKEVESYIKKAKNKSDLARTDLAKEKTGVELKGVKAINPFNNKEVPVFTSDYVLGYYGVGAVMAVPAHDGRDFEFAKKFKLPIIKVINPVLMRVANPAAKADAAVSELAISGLWEGEGELISSGDYSGMRSEKARPALTSWLSKNKLGGKSVNYKMRDWVFSRQRYWGEPIPLVYCETCAERIKEKKYKKGEFSRGELLNPGWTALSEKDLPLELPAVKSYEPTGTGESPLANITSWVKTKCPRCGLAGKRETNTMPQWAGSSWYYIAYIIKKGEKYAWNKKEISRWLPVDIYVGGVEHATRHLLYARFWHKFLYDIGELAEKEPFKKLMNQGLIGGEDGRKMSKRWGNVINPDDMVNIFGADAFRLYEMFMGPFAQGLPWSNDGIKGARRFLDRVWKLTDKVSSDANYKNKQLEVSINQTIKKVTEDIEDFRFNTAVSAIMILTNKMEAQEKIGERQYAVLISLLAPFAPHITEELWQDSRTQSSKLQVTSFKSVHLEPWPEYDPKLIKENNFELIVQVNGKVRDKIPAMAGISQKEAESIALASEKVKIWVKEGKIKKVIFVPNKLINIVI